MALLVQSFAGVRHGELEQTDPKKDRLRWGDIRLDQDEPEIHIRVEVSKMSEERFVPIPPVFVAWLSVLKKDPHLPVYPNNRLYKDYREICDKAGLKWKKNAPRKSFNTYDTALSRSLVVTAAKAGNSAVLVERYYRKPVSQAGKVAVQWFSIFPREFKALMAAWLRAEDSDLI